MTSTQSLLSTDAPAAGPLSARELIAHSVRTLEPRFEELKKALYAKYVAPIVPAPARLKDDDDLRNAAIAIHAAGERIDAVTADFADICGPLNKLHKISTALRAWLIAPNETNRRAYGDLVVAFRNEERRRAQEEAQRQADLEALAAERDQEATVETLERMAIAAEADGDVATAADARDAAEQVKAEDPTATISTAVAPPTVSNRDLGLSLPEKATATAIEVRPLVLAAARVVLIPELAALLATAGHGEAAALLLGQVADLPVIPFELFDVNTPVLNHAISERGTGLGWPGVTVEMRTDARRSPGARR